MKQEKLFEYLKNLGFVKNIKTDNRIIVSNDDDDTEVIMLPLILDEKHYYSIKKHLDEWGYLSDEDLIEYDELFID